MKFNLKLTPRNENHKVKGINGIDYVVRLPSITYDWTPYEPDFWEQLLGTNDTDVCWEASGVEDNGFQGELFLSLKNLPEAALTFLQLNGYFNQLGQLSFSRDFLAILSGVKDQGGDSALFWGLIKQYGLIPRSMLNYTPTTQDNASREVFVANYFNPNRVTVAMLALGKEFLTYFNTDFEFVGQDGTTPPMADLKASLLQSPLQLAVPIPQDVSLWNSGTIKYDGTQYPSHEVLLVKIDDVGNPAYPYFIADQYPPYIKQLSSDYLLYRVTNGVVTPILQSPYTPPPTAVPYPNNLFTQIMSAIWKFFNP